MIRFFIGLLILISFIAYDHIFHQVEDRNKLSQYNAENNILFDLNTIPEYSSNSKEKVKTVKQAIDYFDEIIKSDAPSKEVLAQVLDKIIIYRNKNLEFRLKVNLEW